jgi:hypothetical protein
VDVDDEPAAQPAVGDRRRAEGKKWIGIKLTDDDGNPVPGARYDVKLPDGTTRSGRLGPDGTAYVRAIPEGDCEVTFPDVDGESWKPA